MKRKFLPFLLALALLLTGCSKNANTAPTTESTPAETVPQTTPAPTPSPDPADPVFYFSNSQQYGRLYEIGTDGKNLALLVDENAIDVQQTGDAVYYLNLDSRLCRYDFAEQTTAVLLDEVSVHTYYVHEDWLFYAVDGTVNNYTDAFYDEWHVANMKTGEDKIITTVDRAASASYGDNLYVLESLWNQEEPVTQYKRYCAATDKLETVFTAPGYFLGMGYANREGLYFCQEQSQNEKTLYTWYFVPKDGTEARELDALNRLIAQQGNESERIISVHMLSVDQENYLYTTDILYHSDAEFLSSIELHYLKADGEDQLLLSTDPRSAAFCDDQTIPGKDHDRVFLEISEYGDWEPDSDTFASGYRYYQNYLFSPAEGTLTSLDLRGDECRMFENGDFPQLNSGTARKPVTAALYSLFVASQGYDGAQPKSNKTHGAWLALADKTADLILVPIPTQEEQDYLDEKGVTIEKKLYGGDGMVMIGSEANPVQNLTHEQIVGIYRGEITNWKELGGPDHEISVYYRNDQSGSQRMFEKLVFENKDVPDFESMERFGIMDEMSTIVDICANDPYAIGYSIMTYLHNVYTHEGVKVFAVDGVMPSAETLKDTSYRYGVPEYAVIRADEAQGSPARRLYDWFGTSICDDLLSQAEMTPIHD